MLIDTVLHRPDDADCSRRKDENPSLVNHCLAHHLEKETALREVLCTDKAEFDLNPSVLTEPLNLYLQADWFVFVDANKIMVPALYEICGEQALFV